MPGKASRHMKTPSSNPPASQQYTGIKTLQYNIGPPAYKIQRNHKYGDFVFLPSSRQKLDAGPCKVSLAATCP
jgi:hypothetical protein